MTITATWEANSYDAVFDANGGKWADGETVKYDKDVEFDSAITAPAEDPTKEGYTFKTNSDGENIILESATAALGLTGIPFEAISESKATLSQRNPNIRIISEFK